MYGLNSSQFACAAFLWPALIAESASEIASAAAREFANLAIEPQPQTGAREPQWTTQNCVALELPTVRLRDFSTTGEGTPTLLCAPFALHGSTITDFAPGHSLVAALQGAGMRRVFVTDWRSASPDMRFLSIDNYLADLNVLVDELGSRVNLLGLCQGGWMALLSELAHDTPIPIFRELVALGGGRILGRHALQFWAPSFPDPEEVRALLQSPNAAGSTAFRRLESRFRDWYASTLDLPGTYYLQVVEHLFKHNHLSTGRFVALSRKVDLSKLRCPLFLLAAGDDDVVAPGQIFATEQLVDRRCSIEKAVAPCGHLGLFMGKEILARIWPDIASWLSH